jgi:hypothetical protein
MLAPIEAKTKEKQPLMVMLRIFPPNFLNLSSSSNDSSSLQGLRMKHLYTSMMDCTTQAAATPNACAVRRRKS